MWVLRLKIKHDCTIGSRCAKFNCIGFSIPLSVWNDKSNFYTSQRHIIEGDKASVKRFLEDLRKDKRIIKIEISQNVAFCIEKRRGRVAPSFHYTPKMFFVKPVFVDRKGYEYWELASWKKEVLMDFLASLEKEKALEVTLEKFQNVSMDTISFPKVAPNLSSKQQEAFQLAVEKGYYAFPRGADLKDMAKLMKISTSTFQEHLRRAEEKIMPSYT